MGRQQQSSAALLRERGLRVTPQRQAVLNLYLHEAGFHATADQVRARLLPSMPGLARGTTYKVLSELVHSGLCEEIPTAGGVSLYGLALTPHQHFLCEQCGRWFDVDLSAGGGPDLKPIGLTQGASVNSWSVLFRGLCADCAAPR